MQFDLQSNLPLFFLQLITLLPLQHRSLPSNCRRIPHLPLFIMADEIDHAQLVAEFVSMTGATPEQVWQLEQLSILK